MKTRHLLRRFFDGIRDSLREYLGPDGERRLLEILSEEYVEKSENVMKLRDYAARMTYPQFRDNLLRIADEEQGYVDWLAEHITAAGGNIPRISFSPKPGKNDWERLLIALEKKKRQVSDRIDRLVQLQRVHPEIGEELRRMRQEEEIHRREIQAMAMRSDPQAGWDSKNYPS
jgi:chromosome segregation ATPase